MKIKEMPKAISEVDVPVAKIGQVIKGVLKWTLVLALAATFFFIMYLGRQ